VHVLIGAGKIAQGFPDTVRSRLEDEPLVPPTLCLLQRHGETELEWHIESWRCRRCRIEFDTREVMEGVPASAEEVDDPLEPALTTRDLECGARNQCEAAESGEEREEQLLVLCIVGNVEERGIAGEPPRSPSRLPARRCHLPGAYAQACDVRVRVLATRLEATFLAAFVARLWRVIRAALRRRRCTMSSISAAICRARFAESPISLAVSSIDGTGLVIRVLRGMAPRYEARHRVSILERLFSHRFEPHRCRGSVNGGIGYRALRAAPMPKDGYTRLIRKDSSRSAGAAWCVKIVARHWRAKPLDAPRWGARGGRRHDRTRSGGRSLLPHGRLQVSAGSRPSDRSSAAAWPPR